MEESKIGRKDYWYLGLFYIKKSFALTAVIAVSLVILAKFGLPLNRIFPRHEKGCTVYQFDDPRLLKTDAVVCIADSSGCIRYHGQVKDGQCVGVGVVYNEDGKVVYNGPMQEAGEETPEAEPE